MSLFDLFKNNDDDDVFGIDKTESLPKDSPYLFSPYQAFKIAAENHHLKSDYCKRTFKNISYLDFTDCDVDLVDADNGRKYWLVQITRGRFSTITITDDDETIFSDGSLSKDDFRILRCLIDVNTGDYTYYPEE